MQINPDVLGKCCGTARIVNPAFYGLSSRLCSTSRIFAESSSASFSSILSLTRREIGVVRGTTDDGRKWPGPHETLIPGSVVPITSRWCKESCSDAGRDESPEGTGVRLGNPDRKGPVLCLELGVWSDTMSAKMRWVEITDSREIEMMQEDIGAPMVHLKEGHYWALADEVRAWRLQNTSEGGSDA